MDAGAGAGLAPPGIRLYGQSCVHSSLFYSLVQTWHAIAYSEKVYARAGGLARRMSRLGSGEPLRTTQDASTGRAVLLNPIVRERDRFSVGARSLGDVKLRSMPSAVCSIKGSVWALFRRSSRVMLSVWALFLGDPSHAPGERA